MSNTVTKINALPSSLFGLAAGIITLLSGCATTPPAQEMSDARQSLETAQTIGAEQHAPEALDNAQLLLSRAEDDMKSGNYEEAHKEAVAAHEAAREAVAITQAKQEEPAATTEPLPLSLIPSEPAMPNHYVVGVKENLWAIAAKPSVYGDSRLWPLLLKANADIIKKADIIKPGITLQIERTLSAEEIEAALNYSRSRSKGSRTSTDIGYLRQYGLR